MARKPLLILSLLILSLLVLAWLAFWPKKQLIPQVQNPPPGSSPPALISTDPTATWKTYRNEEHNYKINYPENWVLDEKYKTKGIVWFRTKTNQAEIKAGKPATLYSDIEIKFYNSPVELPDNQIDQLPFQQWIDQKADGYGFIQKKPILIDKILGHKGIVLGLTTHYVIFVEHNEKIYEISTGNKVPTINEQKMINSFEFID